MLKFALISILLLSAFVQAQSCGKQEEVKEIFSVKSKVELLFFFKKDSSIEDRNAFNKRFDDKFLLVPTSEGYVPGDTVQAVFGIDKDGYEGFGLKFRPNITKEQKEEVRKYITDSPLIFRIYENVVPNEISDLDHAKNKVKEIFSVSSKVELLFFFKKDSSMAARDVFYETVLNKPVSGGYWPRDGVQATFGIDRNGYEGFGIKFRENATEDQKHEIKKLIEEAPVVYKVYENVVPNEIQDL